TCLLGPYQGRPATAEEVENIFPWLGRIMNRPHRKFDRLLGEVLHALRVDFFHRPDIGNVGWTIKLMGGTFPPAKETPFVVAHEAFAGEHRMHLVPDDLLREIQPRRLKGAWIIANVGVPSPDEEQPTRKKDPRHVTEPSQQHFIKRLLRHK